MAGIGIECVLSAERRRRITTVEQHLIVPALRELPVTVDTSRAERAWREPAHLAASHGLTAYDATYLELALRLAVPLASRNEALMEAACDTGVVLVVVR